MANTIKADRSKEMGLKIKHRRCLKYRDRHSKGSKQQGYRYRETDQ